MNRILIFFCIIILVPSLSYSAENKSGSSKFVVWNDLKTMEPLKVAWDFNFENPEDARRALNPIVYAIKANADYGPVSFDPMQQVVVSHGGEAVIWVKKNYKHFKALVDQARLYLNSSECVLKFATQLHAHMGLMRMIFTTLLT